MNKLFYYALSGQFLVFVGLMLFFSHKIDFGILLKVVPVLLLLTGSCVLVFSLYRNLPNHANRLHLVQGIASIVFGLFVLLMIDTSRNFFLAMLYFVIVFGMFEILFSFLTQKSIPRFVILSRLMAGIVNFIGGIVLLMVTMIFSIETFFHTSILITFSGVSMLLFASNVRKYLHESDTN
jgi:uncharacterized membrane protein HdeD (DUF308 family)